MEFNCSTSHHDLETCPVLFVAQQTSTSSYLYVFVHFHFVEISQWWRGTPNEKSQPFLQGQYFCSFEDAIFLYILIESICLTLRKGWQDHTAPFKDLRPCNDSHIQSHLAFRTHKVNNSYIKTLDRERTSHVKTLDRGRTSHDAKIKNQKAPQGV